MPTRWFLFLLAVVLAACAPPGVTPSSPEGTTQAPYITDPAKTGFSIYQGGRLIAPQLESGYLTYRPASKSFVIKTRFKSMRIYLSEKDAGEFRQTAKSKLSVLSFALVGAATEDSRSLFIADHADPLSSNNSLDPSSGLKPTSSTENSYEVRTFYHLKTEKETDLSKYSGTLFGYTWVDVNGDAKIGLGEVSRIKLFIHGK